MGNKFQIFFSKDNLEIIKSVISINFIISIMPGETFTETFTERTKLNNQIKIIFRCHFDLIKSYFHCTILIWKETHAPNSI